MKKSYEERLAYQREWARRKRRALGVPERKLLTDEERKAYKERWRKKNKKSRVEYAIEWNRANPETHKAAVKKWKQSEKGRLSAKKYKRARRSCESKSPWGNPEEINRIYTEAAAMGLSVDHIVPLRSPLVCGLHVEANLFVMPIKENQIKGNRWWPNMPEGIA